MLELTNPQICVANFLIISMPHPVPFSTLYKIGEKDEKLEAGWYSTIEFTDKEFELTLI